VLDFLFALGVVSYNRAALNDPGVVLPGWTERAGRGWAPWHPNKVEALPLCEHCGERKPLRARHSTAAGCCVLRFNHFCFFLHGAVGAYNYKFFIQWMWCQSSSCLFSLVLIYFYGWEAVEARSAIVPPGDMDSWVAWAPWWLVARLVASVGTAGFGFTFAGNHLTEDIWMYRRNMTLVEYMEIQPLWEVAEQTFGYHKRTELLEPYTNPFDRGTAANLRALFGRRAWLLGWLPYQHLDTAGGASYDEQSDPAAQAATARLEQAVLERPSNVALLERIRLKHKRNAKHYETSRQRERRWRSGGLQMPQTVETAASHQFTPV
jgi:hypothetical protein